MICSSLCLIQDQIAKGKDWSHLFPLSRLGVTVVDESARRPRIST